MTAEGDASRDAIPFEGTVTVTEDALGGYIQQIIAGGHRLLADEPNPIGNDHGPTPERVRVTFRHCRIHAQDCAECESRIVWIDHIDRHIALSGNLNDVQRQRLLQIADRCDVHRTMTSEVDIATSLSW